MATSTTSTPSKSEGTTRKMTRGISKATDNEILVFQARATVESDLQNFESTRSLLQRQHLGQPEHEKLFKHEEEETDAVDSPTTASSICYRGKIVNSPEYLTSTSTIKAASTTPSSSALLAQHSSNYFGFLQTPVYTFILPDLSCYPNPFRDFLERDLIEISAMVSLETSGQLNWWAQTGVCQRLWPIATTGDGNCLLHAASLAMWGFHDRLLTLRKALHGFLTEKCVVGSSIHRRWKHECHLQNLIYGLVLTEQEWEQEWHSVLRLASAQPRISPSAAAAASAATTTTPTTADSSGTEQPVPAASRRRSRLSMVSLSPPNLLEDSAVTGGGVGLSTFYESLEEIHVLALAHILRRPIIVVSDTVLRDMNGEALAPIPFGGIYLPLEIAPSDCHQSPLLLTYDHGHFSALVSMQQSLSSSVLLPAVIPVTYCDHQLLPIHFIMDPSSDTNNTSEASSEYNDDASKLHLLAKYLDLVQVALPEAFVEPEIYNAYNNISNSMTTTTTLTPSGGDEMLMDRSPSVASSTKSNSSSTSGSSVNWTKRQIVTSFGSLGKTVSRKLKKNFNKFNHHRNMNNDSGFKNGGNVCEIKNGRHWTKDCQSGVGDHGDHNIGDKIVSGNQPFILCALLHDYKLPIHNEMIANYIKEAKIRYEEQLMEKSKKMEEAREAEEKRKREIYLSGGYDSSSNAAPSSSSSYTNWCTTPTCVRTGTSETNFKCKRCYDNDRLCLLQQSTANKMGRSKFYVESPTATSTAVADGAVDSVDSATLESSKLVEQLRVDLPVAKDQIKVFDPNCESNGGYRECRAEGCQYFGTVKSNFYCSKCYCLYN